MALIGTSRAVTFTGLPAQHHVSNPVTFAALPPQHFTSNPVAFTAPSAYFMQRRGDVLVPVRVGVASGGAIEWLSPPL